MKKRRLESDTANMRAGEEVQPIRLPISGQPIHERTRNSSNHRVREGSCYLVDRIPAPLRVRRFHQVWSNYFVSNLRGEKA
jgi:hypothetical protein